MFGQQILANHSLFITILLTACVPLLFAYARVLLRGREQRKSVFAHGPVIPPLRN